MYEYNAVVTRVVDGDTVHANVDLGCDIHIDLTLRLAHINAPENSTLEGQQATQWLKNKIEGLPVVLRTIKDRKEKYGRYLATIELAGEDIGEAAIAGGYAKAYEGGAR